MWKTICLCWLTQRTRNQSGLWLWMNCTEFWNVIIYPIRWYVDFGKNIRFTRKKKKLFIYSKKLHKIKWMKSDFIQNEYELCIFFVGYHSYLLSIWMKSLFPFLANYFNLLLIFFAHVRSYILFPILFNFGISRPMENSVSESETDFSWGEGWNKY